MEKKIISFLLICMCFSPKTLHVFAGSFACLFCWLCFVRRLPTKIRLNYGASSSWKNLKTRAQISLQKVPFWRWSSHELIIHQKFPQNMSTSNEEICVFVRIKPLPPEEEVDSPDILTEMPPFQPRMTGGDKKKRKNSRMTGWHCDMFISYLWLVNFWLHSEIDWVGNRWASKQAHNSSLPQSIWVNLKTLH